jgi:glycerophosphoryl diester phosphodiesterase
MRSEFTTWIRQRDCRPLVLGHRGVRGDAPENTMSAFRLAKEQGADGVELDIRLDASGDAVVSHDRNLERVTKGEDSRKVEDLTREELNWVNVGDGQRIPRLIEVLDWAETASMRVNIEVKHDVPSRFAVVRELARILRARTGAGRSIIVSSFDPAIVLLVGRATRVPTALLFESEQKFGREGRAWRAIGATAVNPERVLCSPERIRRWKKRGALINVWTVNDPTEARDLAALGVDGIVSDHPGEIVAALDG